MTEEIRTHDKRKEAHETLTMLCFLLALAKNDSEYAFLNTYESELEKEIFYIRQSRGADCHEIPSLTIGKGEIPVLYNNTESEESTLANYGCDFVLNTREGSIRTIAKKHNLTEKEVNLCSWLQIYFEITDCVNQTEQEIYHNPDYSAKLPKGFYPVPAPRKAVLTNKERKAETDHYIKQANNSLGDSISGDKAEKLWAEKVIGDIKRKIKKQKNKLKTLAEKWAAQQKAEFPVIIEKWQKDNESFKAEQRKKGIDDCVLYAKPDCPTEKDWPAYPGRDNLKQIWLLIRSEYFLEFTSSPKELARHLIWQAGKENLIDFMPFSRLIIATGRGFIVFKNNWFRYEIWPSLHLEY